MVESNEKSNGRAQGVKRKSEKSDREDVMGKEIRLSGNEMEKEKEKVKTAKGN